MFTVIGSKSGTGVAVPAHLQQQGTAEEERAFLMQLVGHCPFLSLYRSVPKEALSIFDLEALVMRRMELLAYIDSLRQSPAITSSQDLMTRVARAVKDEDFVRESKYKTSRVFASVDASRAELDEGVYLNPDDLGGSLSFNAADDAIAHMCCRLVFCQSPQWRDWFVKQEETLFRVRLHKLLQSRPLLRPLLFAAVQLPCEPVDLGALDPSVREYLVPNGDAGVVKDFYYVPLTHALRSVRYRHCVCVKGRAIVPMDNVMDAYFAEFRYRLQQGLVDAGRTRHRVLQTSDSRFSSQGSTVAMLDAFFARFIVDPQDALKPASTGAITAADVPRHAAAHFPPCMRRSDEFLRKEKHMKHKGRWQYGLFLKAIGLSLEDSVLLFSTLMTLKAPKDGFDKSAYGYNIRHMYGREGKKTSYSSLTCSTIINSPPNTDKHDCHGCPFRYNDEGALRGLLSQPRPSPLPGADPIRLNPADIEDIVIDSRDRHYTRACFKFFVKTHAGVQVQRETLFRSPFEYYSTSVEACAKGASLPMAASPVGGDKRPRDSLQQDGTTPKRTTLGHRAEEGAGPGSPAAEL